MAIDESLTAAPFFWFGEFEGACSKDESEALIAFQIKLARFLSYHKHMQAAIAKAINRRICIH